MLWVYRMIGNGFFSENPKELDISQNIYILYSLHSHLGMFARICIHDSLYDLRCKFTYCGLRKLFVIEAAGQVPVGSNHCFPRLPFSSSF